MKVARLLLSSLPEFKEYKQSQLLLKSIVTRTSPYLPEALPKRVCEIMDVILANLDEKMTLDVWKLYLNVIDKEDPDEKQRLIAYNLDRQVVPQEAAQGDANAAGVLQIPEAGVNVPSASKIARTVDSSDELDEEGDRGDVTEDEQDENGNVGKLGKRKSQAKLDDVPSSPKPRLGGDEVMHDQTTKASFHGYAGTDYDVDYIATRLDRLRDW